MIGVGVDHHWVVSSCSDRLVASQRGQNELLLPVWPGLHHRGPPGHVARHAHFLQESQVYRLVRTNSHSSADMIYILKNGHFLIV